MNRSTKSLGRILGIPIGLDYSWFLIFALLTWTLAYLLLFPGGIVGYEWVLLGIAFLVDLTGHGGTYRHRNRMAYQRSETI